jgi:hypothetical protein
VSSVLPGFPNPALAPIITKNRKRFYRTPDGDFPSVTTINKVLGLAQEGLIAWSANMERAACLEAATEVFASGEHEDGPAGFRAAVEAHIGPSKQHQLALNKAADIGTAIHGQIQWYLRGLLGLTRAAEPPVLTTEAQWGFAAWLEWWKGAGLTVLATEQPVWDAEYRYAGTIDIVAQDASGRIGVVDTKSSKGIYDEYHLQVAAYMHAARNFSPIEWGMITRVPKVVGDVGIETKWLGNLYARTLTEAQLFESFTHARALYGMLVEEQ